MSTHGLDLGTLDLASGQVHEDGYKLSVLGNGASFGASQAAVREIVSMLADGNLVSYDRAGNREATFDVLIEGADGVALQAGEVALRRELYRPNTVTWTPPADFSAPTVFEVLTSEMAPQFDDVDELRGRRKFRVTLTCAPHARSAAQSTVDALGPPPVTPVIATITDCTTTAGWMAAITYVDASNPMDPSTYSTLTVADMGADGVSAGANGYRLFMEYTPPTPVSLAGTPYVSLTMRGSTPARFDLKYVGIGPGSLDVVSPVRTVALPGGLLQYVLPANPTKTLEQLYFTAEPYGTGYSTNSALAFNVFDVSRTDTLPQVSARQQTRILTVSGTERTPASIRVESQNGITDLGLTLVHTSPEDGSGYSPPMRRWRTQGNGTPTPDANTFSGAYEPIHPQSFEAKVLTAALPAGGYQLVAVMACSSVSTRVISWSTGTIPPGSATREGLVEGSTVVSFTAANTWQLVPLGEPLSLPSVRTAAGLVQVGLLRDDPANGALPTVQLDELWLFRVDDDCHLSVVDCDEPNLWLDSPDVASGVPTAWMGATSEARRHPGLRLKAQGNHHLLASGTALFTATRDTDNPKTSATFYDRYHSNAAT